MALSKVLATETLGQRGRDGRSTSTGTWYARIQAAGVLGMLSVPVSLAPGDGLGEYNTLNCNMIPCRTGMLPFGACTPSLVNDITGTACVECPATRYR